MDNENISEIIGNLMKLSNSILGSVVPEEAKRHFRSACKEALLGMIVILDGADEKGKNNASENSNKTKESSRTIEISD